MDLARLGPVDWDGMLRAVELVKERLRRAHAALDAAGIPHCVVGGNAVAAWVSRVDPAAVRNTPDVDILLRRADFAAARGALEQAGFVHRRADGLDLDMFLDGPGGKAREAVHVIFAGEKIRPAHEMAAPDVFESEMPGPHPVIELESLVGMKLVSFRLTDRVHLQDPIEVGLVDRSWPDGKGVGSLLKRPGASCPPWPSLVPAVSPEPARGGRARSTMS